MNYDICAAVISDLSTDARVWKEVGSLCDAGYAVHLIGCGYEMTEIRTSERQGVTVTEIPIGTRSKSPSYQERVRAVSSVWRAVIATKARAYHCHNIHVLPPCAWAASRLSAPLIYDAHELYGDNRAGERLHRKVVHYLERRLEAYALRHADGVITTNPSRALVLKARHGLRDIAVVGNTPKTVHEVVPWNPGFPEGVPVLLYQGGIYAEERPFREIIEALRLLEGVHFAVVGFGREQQITLLRSWAREAGVESRVHVLPAVPFDRLVSVAAAATVGIVPLRALDLGYYLGDTNKLYEYLMGGLPVIATDLPEVRRIVSSGSPPVGELFVRNDPAEIAEAYRSVVTDGKAYEARRREARRLAMEAYNWERDQRGLLELYAELLPAPLDRPGSWSMEPLSREQPADAAASDPEPAEVRAAESS